jgi:tetratricopeptide (TPR) repeat protein
MVSKFLVRSLLMLALTFTSFTFASSLTLAPVTSPAVFQNNDLAEADKLSQEIIRLYDETKYEEALTLAKRALKIREKLLAPNARLLADTYNTLALLYIAALRFGDAESPLKSSLAIYEKDAAANALMIGKTLDNLALVRYAKRDPKKAEEFYLRALATKEKTLGPDHDETINTINYLADFYRREREYVKANAMLQRVITAKEKKLGASHHEIGKLLELQACLLHKSNQNSEAEKVEARANHILYRDSAVKPEPVALSNDAFMCKLVTNPRPDYVSVARGRRFPSPVKLAVEIETDEAGNVTTTRFIGYDPAFKSIVEKAARNAKLRPTIVDGRAVKVKGVITHEFFTMTTTVLVPATVGGRP